MHALDWAALLTAGVTAVMLSQTSFGATIQKSMLRLAGATLGGALGIATIVIAMPNIESIGALLLVAAPGLGIAAWLAAGSSGISYVGFQTGLAFALCVTDPVGPTIDLATGRDRVLGIMVGVLVMLLINAVVWPARGRLAMWSALARALRSLAALSRLAPETRDYPGQLQRAVRLRSGIYQELAATLRLRDEAALEPDALESQAERERVTQLTVHAQAVFLADLALIRHRLAPGFPTLSAPMQDAMREIDASVGGTLKELAERLEGGPLGPLPNLEERLAAFEALIPMGTSAAAEAAVRDHGAIARTLVHEVDQLRQSMDGVRTPWTREIGQPRLVPHPGQS
jgi:multidrug resistance protein MdtO